MSIVITKVTTKKIINIQKRKVGNQNDTLQKINTQKSVMEELRNTKYIRHTENKLNIRSKSLSVIILNIKLKAIKKQSDRMDLKNVIHLYVTYKRLTLETQRFKVKDI